MVENDSRPINDYRDLDVWNEAMAFCERIYEVTKDFPREEMFGLTSQMRRAAVSIPSNIAEGYGREQTKSFIQYLRISQGSLKELETQVLLATRLDYMSQKSSQELLLTTTKIGKMLRAFIRSLEKKLSI